MSYLLYTKKRDKVHVNHANICQTTIIKIKVSDVKKFGATIRCDNYQ